jgi:hypothetical protein
MLGEHAPFDHEERDTLASELVGQSAERALRDGRVPARLPPDFLEARCDVGVEGGHQATFPDTGSQEGSNFVRLSAPQHPRPVDPVCMQACPMPEPAAVRVQGHDQRPATQAGNRSVFSAGHERRPHSLVHCAPKFPLRTQ